MLIYKTTKLKANPSKTSFMMLGPQGEAPIQVGDTMIEESETLEFLGVVFNKKLNWNSHLDKVRGKLNQSIGTLTKLSWQLPRRNVIQLITPIFTSKMQYALGLLVDVTAPEKDMVLKELESLHRQAMKVALGLGRRRSSNVSNQELLKRTGQSSVLKIATDATALLAWKCLRDPKENALTGDSIENHLQQRITRQNLRSFPPQKNTKSIIYRMVELWEQMDNVKDENNVVTVKKKIKSMFKCH